MNDDFERFRKVVQLLQAELPCALEVIVRQAKLQGYDGLCLREEKRFLILISEELEQAMAIETVLHEWAHARSWTLLHDQLQDEEFRKICHNAAWGVAYAEVYRVYEASVLQCRKCSVSR